MKYSLPEKNDIISLLKRSSGEQIKTSTFFTIPTLLFPVEKNHWNVMKGYSTRSEEITLIYLREMGMNGERTRKSLYTGYTYLFRQLYYPPPWIEVTPIDTMVEISDERARDLHGLFWQIKEKGKNKVLDLYEGYLRTRNEIRKLKGSQLSKEYQEEIIRIRKEEFLRLISLANCLSEKNFENLLSVVFDDFDYNVFEAATGAPDLFIWDPETYTWFFVEVKGPGDSLRKTQKEWIIKNWKCIKRHVILITLYIYE